ncbi:PhzF family phenazine biosynthesis isomerase [Intrasporangium sp.]|uniref:PhzF family phenazine biosynthesis protein n=1 Tax=Intrasporangium sp. TaxID=1925024 RepID=UPI00293A671B|nr:PhzF family phenazine biosynthesis isomerase [Intrasporangium sp.]MDV3223318.1 PhzF family phenazine biosynthesis protein [Intrasporangium sp.]
MTSQLLRYAAFTRDPAGGNPAGVVLDSGDLADADMQQLAAEVGYSETAFLTVPAADGTVGVRYFSPAAEVPFCGHATVASAVAIAERTGQRSLHFRTTIGEVSVEVRDSPSGREARLVSVETSSSPIDDEILGRLLTALRWSATDLDPTWPVHVAYAGNHHPILTTHSRARLQDLDYDFDALKALMIEQDWTTVNLLWWESDSVVHSRNPFPVGGVVEDPATGAAAAALGGYLIATQPPTSPRQLLIRQGEDLGRPSRLGLGLTPGSTRAVVSGTAVRIPD